MQRYLSKYGEVQHMDKSIDSAIKKYAEAVKRYIPRSRIFLYGSYARGYSRETSDIDIAVIVDKIDGNYLEMSARLVELIEGIDVRIEPLLLCESHDKSGFTESILNHGILIS